MQYVSRTRLPRQQQFYLDLRSNWGTKTTRLLLKLSWCRRSSYLPCTAAPLQQRLKEEYTPLRWHDSGHFWIFATKTMWTASSEFGTYRLCEERRFRRACASAQSRQNLRCSLIQAVSQEEPSDRKPDPWPFWMAGHAQLKFVMTECSKTQIRLTGLMWQMRRFAVGSRMQLDCMMIWASSRENVSSEIFDQVRFKPGCSATETG